MIIVLFYLFNQFQTAIIKNVDDNNYNMMQVYKINYNV